MTVHNKDGHPHEHDYKRMRLYAIVSMVFAIAIMVVAFVLVFSVGNSSLGQEENVPAEPPHTTSVWVKSVDGRTVPCIWGKEGAGGGISCDWAYTGPVPVESATPVPSSGATS